MKTSTKGTGEGLVASETAILARKVGRPGIVDEFSGLPVSRQRKWQLRQMAKGGCRICGQTAISKGYCLKHLVQERDHSANRFGYQRQNLNCKSRLLERYLKSSLPASNCWNHEIVSVREQCGDINRATQDLLVHKWGEAGWELTSVVPQSDGDVLLYFKQPAVAPMAPGVNPATRPVRQAPNGVSGLTGSPALLSPSAMATVDSGVPSISMAK
jgi:hypothetical protein